MFIKKILTASFLLGAVVLFGQNEVDIYRYGNTFNEGSARFEAMGGSFGALGAESGCARINPAGFGRYSNSTIGFNLNGIAVANTAHFQGENTSISDFFMRVSNANVAIVSDKSLNRQGFVFSQFSFGVNRVANFNNQFSYSGTQFESLLDVFCANGAGIAPVDLYNNFPFSTSLAYETYAIDYDDANGVYIPRLTNGDMQHSRTVTTKGGISEYYINVSGNYLNKLYIGANLGIQSIRYDETIDHHETLLDTIGVSLRSFDYQYHFKTKGNGYNLKVGAIYLPQDNVRIGLALHTPTAFNLTDDTDANMTATHSDGIKTVPTELVPSSNYKYRYSSPARIIGSFAYVFGKKGCINVDAEYLNYAWGKLKTTLDNAYTSYSYSTENAVAQERLTSVLNIRIGGEYCINSQYFLRAGYAYLPKGDKGLLSYGKKYDQAFSGGIGYRWNALTIDFAIKQLVQTKMYQAFDVSTSNLDLKTTTIVLGFSYKFT